MPLSDLITDLTEINHNKENTSVSEILNDRISHFVKLISAQNPEDPVAMDTIRDALSQLGSKEQNSFWQINKQLIQPVQQLITDTRYGGRVNELLQKLHKHILELQPPKNKTSLKQYFLLLFSSRHSAFEMWIDSFPGKRKDTEELIYQLNTAEKQLKQDNLLLIDNKKNLEFELSKLDSIVSFISIILEELHKIATVTEFVEREFIPATQQRYIEMQQQLLVARQSVLTVDLIIRQNRSLIHNIGHSVGTITSALDVAASIVMAKNRGEKIKQISTKHPDVEQLRLARQSIDKTLDDIEQLSNSSVGFVNGVQSNNMIQNINSDS